MDQTVLHWHLKTAVRGARARLPMGRATYDLAYNVIGIKDLNATTVAVDTHGKPYKNPKLFALVKSNISEAP